jgi:hypothetical protein
MAVAVWVLYRVACKAIEISNRPGASKQLKELRPGAERVRDWLLGQM